jgi:hypothetical protein
MVSISKLKVLGGLEKILSRFSDITVPLGTGLTIFEAGRFILEYGETIQDVPRDVFFQRVETVLPYTALFVGGLVVGIVNKYVIRRKLRVERAKEKIRADREKMKESRSEYISTLVNFDGFISGNAPIAKMISEEYHYPQSFSEKKIIPNTHASRKPSPKKKQLKYEQIYYEELYEKNLN